MDLSTLAAQNPWWSNGDAIDRDMHILRFERSRLKWHPRLAAFIRLDGDGIYLLRGPRQVGKTTLMKLLLRDQIRSGVTPRNLMYFTCDMLRSRDELYEVLKLYLDFARRRSVEDRLLLFIDEVSTLPDWEKGIKLLYDLGALTNVTMILSGSHCLELKSSTERLPGRRGESDGPLNLTLMPMKFSEYVETVRPELFGKIGIFHHLHREDRFRIVDALFRGEIDQETHDEYLIHRDPLSSLFDDYLLTGGLMWSIESYHAAERIDPSVYEIFIRSLLGDLARWKYREDIAKQVVRSLLAKMTTRVSLNSIAKENELGSHNTVSSYLKALEDSFTINTFFRLELDGNEASFKGERKIYFEDPFLYHAFNGWLSGGPDYYELAKKTLIDPVEKSRLVEMVVSNHLIRLLYSRYPSDVFSHQDRLFFWRKKGTDREIDFVMKQNDSLLPIEVKYRNKVDPHNGGNFAPFRKGLTLGKGEFLVDGTYCVVPADYFLLLV